VAVSRNETEVRAERVEVLTRVAVLTDEQLDALLDSTEAERESAARVSRDAAVELLRLAGVLPPRPATVLDLDLRRVVALAAVYHDLQSWWPQPGLEERPLVDLLKVIPRVAERVVWRLRWAGWLPPKEESGAADR
jgi:hypothetical protein